MNALLNISPSFNISDVRDTLIAGACWLMWALSWVVIVIAKTGGAA